MKTGEITLCEGCGRVLGAITVDHLSALEEAIPSDEAAAERLQELLLYLTDLWEHDGGGE